MFRYPITITIDTNIFDSMKYDLSDDSKLQVLLKQVKDGKVKVVLSDIVLKEAKAHLEKYSSDLYSQIRQNRNQLLKIANENLIYTVGLEEYLEIPDKAKIINLANEKFNQYISDLEADILEISMVDINEIVDDYFEIRAPFQSGEKKRKEFPDAFIVNQIKTRFPDENSLIILSNDNGFINGCLRYKNYKVIRTLDDLLKQISKQDEQYELAIIALKNLKETINESILNYVRKEENLYVAGQTVDKDGVIEGHEYTETYLRDIRNVSHRLHIIDDIEEDVALITLACEADIEMDCYYEDTDNAPWDDDEKEYVFVETVHLLEKYRPRFACRIKINLKNNEVSLLPLRIIMGNSSKIESTVIEDVDEDYDPDYMLNEERESAGLQKLNKYTEYVEDKLLSSRFNKDIVALLNEYSKAFMEFEDVSISVDDLATKLEEAPQNQKEIILESMKEKLSDFEFINIPEPLLFEEKEIKKWLDNLFEYTSNLHIGIVVPDYLELGKEYKVIGINDSLEITIDNISTDYFSEGDEEWIDIDASTDIGDVARGSIKLRVGYMHFDEDGCAADGIDDEVAIDYVDIKKLVEAFINEQKDILNEYKSLMEILIDICQE